MSAIMHFSKWSSQWILTFLWGMKKTCVLFLLHNTLAEPVVYYWIYFTYMGAGSC